VSCRDGDWQPLEANPWVVSVQGVRLEAYQRVGDYTDGWYRTYSRAARKEANFGTSTLALPDPV
jgi:hypothetical protein